MSTSTSSLETPTNAAAATSTLPDPKSGTPQSAPPPATAACPLPDFYSSLPSKPVCLATTQDARKCPWGGPNYAPAWIFAPDVPAAIQRVWQSEIAPAVVHCLRALRAPWVVVNVVAIGRTSAWWDLPRARSQAANVLWVGVEPGLSSESAVEIAIVLKSEIRPLFPGVEVEVYETANWAAAGPGVLPPEPHIPCDGDRIPFESGLGMELSILGNSHFGTGGLFLRLNGDPHSLYAMTCQHVLHADRDAAKEPDSSLEPPKVLFRQQGRLEEHLAELEASRTAIGIKMEKIQSELAPYQQYLNGDISGVHDREHDLNVGHAHMLQSKLGTCDSELFHLGYIIPDVQGLGQETDRIIGTVYFHPPRLPTLPTKETREAISWVPDFGLIQLDLAALGPRPRLNAIALTREEEEQVRKNGFGFEKGERWQYGVGSIMTIGEFGEFLQGKDRGVMMRGASTGLSFGEVGSLASVTRSVVEEGMEVYAFEPPVFGHPPKAFPALGDSGAVVSDKHGRAVGILTGGCMSKGGEFDVSYLSAAPVWKGYMSDLGLRPELA